MVTVCAWCEVAKAPAARVVDLGHLSHGICAWHFGMMRLEAQRLRGEVGR